MMRSLLSTMTMLALCATLAAAQTETGKVEPEPTPGEATTQPAAAAVGTIKREAPADAVKNEAPAVPVVRGAIVLPAEKASPVRIPRFESAPIVDGKLDEEVWKSAVVLRDFYQIRPGDNIAPSQPTEVLVGYDSKNLYLAFRAHDEPGKVRYAVSKRDAMFDDDWVGVTLDTFNDQRKAYTLLFNPLGIQADAILTEGRGEDFSVDLVMESKGLVSDAGYVVEVAIPFKSLRYEAGKGKLWGFNAVRSVKRHNDERSSWMPRDRNRASTLSQNGHITGLEGISTERTIEIIPSLTVSETGRRVRSVPPSVLRSTPGLVDPGRFVNEPVALDPGLTAKIGLTPTVTLDLALNPDFAQVEADQLVTTANQRFPVFFSEKRPFFLEGLDIFQTSLQPVHTRAIVDPDVAVKLSGKQGRNSFGLMFASDNAPGNFTGDERLDPRNQRFLDKNAYVGVLRLKRDVGKESSLGLTATTYNFIEKHNHLGGFDGRFRLDPQTTFSFQALGTNSRRFFYDPELGRSTYRTGNGFGYAWSFDKSGRNFGYNFNGSGRTPDYRADVGYTPRYNFNRINSQFRYNSDPKPKGKLVSWRFNQFLGGGPDWQGRIQSWTEEAQFALNFQKQTYLGAGYNGGYERVFEEEFGPKRSATRRGAFYGEDSERSTYRNEFFVFAGTTPSKKYSVSGFVNHRWGVLDYDFGAGPKFPRVSPAALSNPGAPLDPGAGRMLFIELNGRYQPTQALGTSLYYLKNKLTRNDTGLVAYDENILSWRTTYQFTRFVFARARIDYATLSSRARGQFLLGWTPSPGTALYAGYNDDVNYNGYGRINGLHEPGLRRNERTFFVKMSYLFRRSIGGS